jgi:putative transposase
MDFLRDTLASSRVIRACTLVDESTQEAHAGSARGKRTREALQVAEDTSYPGAHVVAALDAVTAVRGNPRQLICDNGPELFGKEAVGFWVHSLLAT